MQKSVYLILTILTCYNKQGHTPLKGRHSSVILENTIYKMFCLQNLNSIQRKIILPNTTNGMFFWVIFILN
jgi:hypothetical protein